MTLDASQRATFGALADVLVPAAENMPGASEVDIAGEGLDRVLRVRPDLEPDLARVLETGVGGDAAERVRDLQRDDPTGFDALALAATGGYYTDMRVRARIGYPGQLYDPARLDVDIDATDPMLRRVVDRNLSTGRRRRRCPSNGQLRNSPEAVGTTAVTQRTEAAERRR